MERRVRWKSHARCGAGENPEIISKDYLPLFNTVIFRGRIYDEFKKVGQDGIRFSLQLSNGKDPKTNEWNKPTFADCTAFDSVAKRILNEYKPKDEIWLIAKYYSKQQDGKYYKGFIVREIITEQEIQQASESVFDDLPF